MCYQNRKPITPTSAMSSTCCHYFLPYQYHYKISHAPGNLLPNSNSFYPNFSFYITTHFPLSPTFRNPLFLPENLGHIKLGRKILPRALELSNRAIARQVGQKYCPSKWGLTNTSHVLELSQSNNTTIVWLFFFKNAEMFFSWGIKFFNALENFNQLLYPDLKMASP